MAARHRPDGVCAFVRHCCCSICKAVVTLFTLCLLSFMVEEYVTFGMWERHRFLQVTSCTEAVYNFNATSRDSILEDAALMTSCGVHGNAKITAHARQIFNDFNNRSVREPEIRTKCGIVKSRLLSYYQERTTEQFGDTNKKVPNIVHYVSLGNWEFKFLNYLSFLSVHLFIKPRYIFVHGDGQPYGRWWNRTLQEIPNIYRVERSKPARIQGRKMRWIQHSSDIVRLQTLQDNGGIYLDTDIIVLKSFDPLRQYEVTLGRETYYGLGSGIIVAMPRAPFVCVWFQIFRDYNPFPWNWAYYAVHTPQHLSTVIPDHIHIEEDSLQRPSWEETHLLFKQRIDWSRKFAVHVWKREGHVPDEPSEMTDLNSTLGEIMRFVYNKHNKS